MRSTKEIKRDIDAVNAEERPFACSPPSFKSWREWKLTGLKSELFDAITADIPLDRLVEIANAEREKRCAILPCKVGDTVYIAYRDGIDEDEIDCFTVDKHGHVWFKMLNSMWTDGYAHFGKTVFLTRDAAEATLKGKAHENG